MANRWRKRQWWWGVGSSLAIAGIALVVADKMLEGLSPWATWVLRGGAILAALGPATFITWQYGPTQPPESLRQRAERLTENLQRAMVALAVTSEGLQREVDSGKLLVEKLEQDARTYEELARVNRGQAEAVASLVRGEVRQEGRRSFWAQFAVNLGFFLMGVLVSRFLG